jgi:hypothetical protein
MLQQWSSCDGNQASKLSGRMALKGRLVPVNDVTASTQSGGSSVRRFISADANTEPSIGGLMP